MKKAIRNISLAALTVCLAGCGTPKTAKPQMDAALVKDTKTVLKTKAPSYIAGKNDVIVDKIKKGSIQMVEGKITSSKVHNAKEAAEALLSVRKFLNTGSELFLVSKETQEDNFARLSKNTVGYTDVSKATVYTLGETYKGIEVAGRRYKVYVTPKGQAYKALISENLYGDKGIRSVKNRVSMYPKLTKKEALKKIELKGKDKVKGSPRAVILCKKKMYLAYEIKTKNSKGEGNGEYYVDANTGKILRSSINGPSYY